MARRLALALLLALSAAAEAAREYRVVLGHEIVGNDIKNGATPYTKVCVPDAGYRGKYGFDAFKLICDERPECVAAVAPTVPDGCAYLKAKGARAVIKPNPKFAVVTSQESPQGPCKSFSPLGGKCTTDPWLDSPVCCGGNGIKCNSGVCGSGGSSSSSGSAQPAGPRSYRTVLSHNIEGNDIPGPNGMPYTRVCFPDSGYKGKFGFDAMKAICDDRPGCVAVVTSPVPEGCVYLKTKGTRAVIKPDNNWNVLTSQEKPQGPCKSFAQIGDQCTTDPWVDAPVCCGGNRIPCKNGVCTSG